MLPDEVQALPWPAILVSPSGAVLASSPAAEGLVGTRPSTIAAIQDRFDLLSPSGQPVAQDERPLRRATRAELFEVAGIWRDRKSGRELTRLGN